MTLQLLLQPSWLSKITKIPVAFKLELSTQFGTYANFKFNPCALFSTQTCFVCLSLTVNIQKANTCSPCTPSFMIKEASIAMPEDKIKLKNL